MAKAARDAAWLSLDEAARRLNVHPATLRDWADKGRIALIAHSADIVGSAKTTSRA